MDGGGNVLERTKYTNKRAAADVFAKYAAAKYDCTAVFESTGNYGFKTQLALEEYGIPYKIANPLRLKLSQSGLKTDKLDAERLANRLRMDDIPESYAYPPEDRRVLDILHDRINQVKARVMVLNRQHSILAKYDYEISASGSTDSASDTTTRSWTGATCAVWRCTSRTSGTSTGRSGHWRGWSQRRRSRTRTPSS